MRKAIYIRFVAIIGIAVICSGIISAVIFGINDEKKTEDHLSSMCLAVAYQYEVGEEVALLSDLAGVERITVIAPAGKVLLDSDMDPERMENHAHREEVEHAEAGKVFIITRKSNTMGAPLMYAATQLPDGNVLRLALSYAGIWQSIRVQIPAVFFTMLIAMVISIFIASAFTKRLVLPLEKVTSDIALGHFDHLDSNSGNYYEIDKMIVNIKELLQKIDFSKKELMNEKDKIKFILSNMAEGFVLLDEDKNILLMDDSAKAIFQCEIDVESQNILMLTRDMRIEKAVNDAIAENQSSMFDFKTDSNIYSVHVGPVLGEYLSQQGRGITILLIDVTAERQTQQLRSEFFSNASHELRTPITSVLGFTQMLDNDLISEENRKETYQRIQNETQRMANLIDDILSIARLESNTQEQTKEMVSIREIVHDVAASLAVQAETAGVTIGQTSEDIFMMADRRQLYQLINNLVENAVKYNKEKGKVQISVAQKAGRVVIKVSDTGIGIPPQYQNRVFERFYRVDSGNKKQIPGTGLGLSIVKHIVIHLGGEVSLKSKPGVGTEIAVTLPS